MAKRKKRLEKGIESIREQIKIHEDKRKMAEGEGKAELVDYYEKEIEGLEKQEETKEEQLERL